MFGIPLNLILMRLMASEFRSCMRLFGKKAEKMVNSRISFVLSTLGFFIVFFTLIYFIPAAVFRETESSWDYEESIYYCFVSLATIGFGDYVSSKSFDVL
ncbi:hypothetical protein TNCT_56261 [Trichonephila clavata]|uniref:Potassium channel domain-containing protein n=1 Tax=Trichonephila clavata TaxID=2740835 RepID=A0A8X6FR29_TRICU|nr:hypothetical protein TNCT_56261 [Trichonephila clavata]